MYHADPSFQLLCNIVTARKNTTPTVVSASGATKKLADRGVQTDLETPAVRNKVGRPRKVSETCTSLFHVACFEL